MKCLHRNRGRERHPLSLQPGACNAVRRSGTYRQLKPTGGKAAGSDTRGYFPRLLTSPCTL